MIRVPPLRPRPEPDRYSAAVCRRGHAAASMIELIDEANIPARCPSCGAAVLRQCPSCGGRIRGAYASVLTTRYEPDPFCPDCGTPYPWAGREAIVYHIENQLEEQADLSEGDRRALVEQLRVLTETPGTGDVDKRQAGALDRLRRVAPRAWDAAWPAIREIATAEIKRQLGLPPT